MRRSPFVLLILLAAIVLTSCGGGRPVGSSTRAVLVWNGSLFDGTGRDPVANGAVLIEDGRVAAAGRFDDMSVPDDAVRIDAHGGTIMPGVIDAHVHITTELLAGIDVLSPWLSTGVTTLQDLGVPDHGVTRTRGLLATVPARPPRVQLAGPMITAVGGYPMARPYAGIAHQVANAGEARATVGELIDEEHVSLVKIAVERGYDADYYDPGWPVLSPDEIAAITEEAHRRGKLVAAHVTGPEELRVASEAGVDIASHAPITPAPDDVLREAADRGMIMISTANAWTEEKQQYAVTAAANAARFHELGGRLAIGTDYPFAPASMPLVEFDWLSKAGMSARDIMFAATHESSAAIGRSADLGTLEPGKIADLVVVQGDPLADWHAMQNVTLVLLDGQTVFGTTEATASSER
jgi:enamidase